MLRRVLLVAVVATVVLAGCSGPTGPGASEPTGDGSTDNGPTGDGPAEPAGASVPGVSNGTLSNATALAEANQDALWANGGSVTVDWDTPSTVATFQLVAEPGFETYTLSGSPYGASPDGSVSIWTNESVRVVRTSDGGNASYRLLERGDDVPNVLEGVEDYLAAGEFTVANETEVVAETDGDGTSADEAGENGTLVLTADEYVGETGQRGLMESPSSFSGRLVVGESGLIHEFAVDATDAGETHAYSFTVGDAGVETVEKPDWMADVPAAATLQPRLSVEIENESYLTVESDGGDHVPGGAVLSVSDNETSGEATFDAELAAGDTRYAYFDDATGKLTLTTDRPPAADADPLDSPVSVTLTSADGATFYSGGMAWETGSASAPADGGSGERGSASGGSASGSESSAGSGESSAGSGESSASES